MSHPDPTRDYHDDKPYDLFKPKTKAKVTFQGKTGIPRNKLTGGLEGSVKRMLDITPNKGIGAKTKALRGKAGDMHKRAVDDKRAYKSFN